MHTEILDQLRQDRAYLYGLHKRYTTIGEHLPVSRTAASYVEALITYNDTLITSLEKEKKDGKE